MEREIKEIDRLQYITPSGDEQHIVSSCESFLEGGGRWIQLRMKGSSLEEFAMVGIKLRMLCDRYGAKLIINDSVEVALAVRADGVHLGKSDIETLAARSLLGSHAIIGRTANTLEDIKELADQRIDYIGLGPFRFTTTKERLSPLLGLEGYSKIVEGLMGVDMPIVAVGGILSGDIKDIIGVGVYGVAVSGAISTANDIKDETSKMLDIIENYKQ